jgi:hypothetical protein
MDVDQMSPEENEQHCRKGLCFNCHEPVHVSRNCPKKNGATGKSSNGKNMVCHKTADEEIAKETGSKIEEYRDSEDSDEEDMDVGQIRRIGKVKKEKDF